MVEPGANFGSEGDVQSEPEQEFDARPQPNPEFLLDIGMDVMDDEASDGEDGGAVNAPEVSAESETPEKPQFEQAMEAGEAFTMLVLRGGPALIGMGREELGELTVAHIDHMDEMAEDALLLAAGATIAPRADPMLRTIGFCDSTDVDVVYRRACANPAAEAGVLEVEAVPFITSFDLRAVAEIERSAEDGDGPERAAMQPYVIVEAPTSVALDVVAERMQDRVIFAGDCVGGSFEGKTLIVLDCRSIAEASEVMETVEGAESGFRFHPWVAPVALVEID